MIDTIKVETIAQMYPDQLNVEVIISFEGGNEWCVQTDRDGKYSQQNGCDVMLEMTIGDFTDHADYCVVIALAERAARIVHQLFVAEGD